MNIHLICNAHLDPAWLWELEEGVAEALATFRVAADLCDQFDGFVFNHNEAILYQWVEEHDPSLFSRIQSLCAQGKWHIMGGWFLQPDCNMPSGESMIRQIEEGRRYFKSRFGVEPATAINFDPFGHSRGLVQILEGCGYDSYIVTRPSGGFLQLPDEFVRWIGYDGSEVTVIRRRGYNSMLGEAGRHIEEQIAGEAGRPVLPVLWGIGNHGGGPSRIDLENIAKMQEAAGSDKKILHSTPERFVAELLSRPDGTSLPRWEHDLNPWAPGCYTSQVRIKQKHRSLENLLCSVERMSTHADLLGICAYPAEELLDAGKDLMTAQFHDILPGSSIRAVEEAGLRLLDHGLETLVRVRTRLFLGLLNHARKPVAGCIPVFAYNYQPYPVQGVFACEFQPSNQNWDDTFTTYAVIAADGTELVAQIEHEASNLSLDWRKNVVFRATLPALSIACFRCIPKVIAQKPRHQVAVENGFIHIHGNSLEVTINSATGLVDRVRCDGAELVGSGAFSLAVVADNGDAWGSGVVAYPGSTGKFTLMEASEAAGFSGLDGENLDGTNLDAVRIIEDGPVRTLVEALFRYRRSYAIVTYSVPKAGTMFDVDVQLYWLEPNRMVKLCIPAAAGEGEAFGQVMFGREQFPGNGREAVTQKWQAVRNKKSGTGFAVLDRGCYGSDWSDGCLRVSLLHSPVYSALPIGDRPLVSQDRHHQRMDFGERSFSFRIAACATTDAWEQVEREAQSFNESPYLLSCFPTYGDSDKDVKPGLEIAGNAAVVCTSFRKAHDGGYLIHILNTVPEAGYCSLLCPLLGIDAKLDMRPSGIMALRIEAGGRIFRTDLLGRKIDAIL